MPLRVSSPASVGVATIWSGAWISGPEKVAEDPKAVTERRDKLIKLLMNGEPMPF